MKETLRKHLEITLKKNLQGEVRFSAGDRAIYSTDASNYRHIPLGLVVPRHVEDVVKTVALAREYDVPLLSRGGGTSLAGQTCNTALIMDFSKYLHAVKEINTKEKWAIVEPGIVLDQFKEKIHPLGLTFGPDPATHKQCTIGGMLGNNACGIHAQMAGKMEINTLALEVLTYEGERFWVGSYSEAQVRELAKQKDRQGEIFYKLLELRERYHDQVRKKFPNIPRRVSGYNLDQLLPENGFHVARALVGTESTCVTILQAKLKLIPNPAKRVLVVIGYPDVYVAGDHLPEILKHHPIGLEGLDEKLVGLIEKKGLRKENLSCLPEGKGMLIAEFGADTKEEAQALAQKLAQEIEKEKGLHCKIHQNPSDQEKVWEIRESGLGATAKVPGEKDTWPGWEDAAVPPHRVGEYLREFRSLLEHFGYGCSLYGHFGQGCIHTRIDFDLYTKQGIEKYKNFTFQAAQLVASFGGSLSGEHGDGQARGDLLEIMYGKEIVQAFKEFKSIWDPRNKMNPGKIVEARSRTSDLRLGVTYRPPDLQTFFKYPEDDGSFAQATNRCVGVGKCRKESGGTMCPSYMVTREEKHTTRGRARLLFEMLQGDPLKKLWKEKEVKEALDLCLACKGCKGECPVNVDMATYKAEFNAHYYKWRPRPRTAFAMGFIFVWAQIASRIPRLINYLLSTKPFSELAKKLAGMAPQRKFPKFAQVPFRKWVKEEQKKDSQKGQEKKVVLWVDTFNNYFHPQKMQAAFWLLDHLGFSVTVPDKALCCGRPLYDYGLLNVAKRKLKQILDTLKGPIQEGIPVVVLEPSCYATFKDELINLFPHDRHAQRLKGQTYLLSEFINKFAPEPSCSLLKVKASLHGHCHQKALSGMEEDLKLLERLGVECEVIDSGCCGMAGSFGFEKENFSVSLQCGERVLLPKLRNSPQDHLVIADGFSCHEQIIQHTDKRPLHLAEVAWKAIRR